jgi:hypothetical protein
LAFGRSFDRRVAVEIDTAGRLLGLLFGLGLVLLLAQGFFLVVEKRN